MLQITPHRFELEFDRVHRNVLGCLKLSLFGLDHCQVCVELRKLCLEGLDRLGLHFKLRLQLALRLVRLQQVVGRRDNHTHGQKLAR